jgi:predicted Zn-ribbon and HTH transcriptional regulator
MTVLTRSAALELAKEILCKHQGDKSEALFQILEDYRVMLSRRGELYFQIIEGARCKQCGGVVLKRTHVFSEVTCGGNPVVGCPVCNTFSSGTMLQCCEDIEWKEAWKGRGD